MPEALGLRQKPDDFRSTHCVKRIAFGFDKGQAVLEKLRDKGTPEIDVDRHTNMQFRMDNRQFRTRVGDIDVLVFDYYASGCPSELYVVVKDKAAYKRLKQALGM